MSGVPGGDGKPVEIFLKNGVEEDHREIDTLRFADRSNHSDESGIVMSVHEGCRYDVDRDFEYKLRFCLAVITEPRGP
jgi:hypothetical protein